MKPRVTIAAILAPLTCALCSMCGTLSPSLDDESSPCAVLSAECPQCTLPGPKQACQTAVESSDDTQCIAVLDNPQVVAACSGDGGTDAATDVSSDAPLPACNPVQISPDGGCACSSPCTTSCPAGNCDLTCAAGGDAAGGAPCAPTCEGGQCTFYCPPGASCAASCSGGRCVFVCANGSDCANTCTGGDCTFTCENGAVCNDSCGDAGGCVGY